MRQKDKELISIVFKSIFVFLSDVFKKSIKPKIIVKIVGIINSIATKLKKKVQNG